MIKIFLRWASDYDRKEVLEFETPAAFVAFLKTYDLHEPDELKDPHEWGYIVESHEDDFDFHVWVYDEYIE